MPRDSHYSDRTLAILRESGALKEGHFVLSSGLHSDRYCQCAAALERPAHAQELARLMVESLPRALGADTVLAPALGGVVWGYAVASEIGARSLFAERQPGGPFELRRGFALSHGERVLLAEDVVTTGGSVKELLPLVEAAGAAVVGFCAIADRSGGKFRPSEGFYSLVALDFATYAPAECPLCAKGMPVMKPGSRVDAAVRTG